MNNSMFKFKKIVPALAVAVGISPLASASMLEEVVVTAQKREQNAQDVGIAVSAFSGKQLKDMGATGAKDLGVMTAGVEINMQYGNAPTFTIRGMNVNDFGAGTSPASAVYVDGVYKASNINSGTQFFDIEGVEILKGPQGTLWGKNTTGGAVSVTTVKPSMEMDGYVQLGVGSNGKRIVEAAFGGELTDNLAGRISVQRVTSDGAYDNVDFPGAATLAAAASGENTAADARTISGGDIPSEIGALDSAAVRGQLLWDASDDVEVLAILHHATDKGDNAPTSHLVNDPDPFDEKVSNEFVTERDSTFSGASVQINADLGDGAQLVSITAYDAFDREGGLDSHGPGDGADPGFTQIYLQEFDQFSQEIRYEVTGDKYFLLLGAFYADSTLNQDDSDHYSIGTFFGGQFNYRFKHENETSAIFAHSEFNMTDELKLTVGYRYNDETREQTMNKLWLDPLLGGAALGPDNPGGAAGNTPLVDNSAAGVPDQTFESKGSSYKIGLDWQPTDDLLVYYSYSKGLKSGGYRSDALTSNGFLVAFDDETLFAHEVGMKWDPADNLRVNATYFVYDYQDAQQNISVNLPVFGTLSTMGNMDSVDVSGFESEVIYSPVEGLELGATLSLLSSEINDSSQPTLDGNELGFAANKAYTAFARYETELNETLIGSFQVNYSHTGDHYLSAENVAETEQDYSVYGLNFTVSNDSQGWDVSLYGKNLGNEIYATNLFQANGVFISEPKSYGINFTKSF